MPTLTMAALVATIDAGCDTRCQTCHCKGEGCDGVVCHGLDAD
jgi:hypothetical protein